MQRRISENKRTAVTLCLFLLLLVIGVIAWATPGGILGIWDIAVEHGRTFNLGANSDFWSFSLKPRISLLALLITNERFEKIVRASFYISLAFLICSILPGALT